MQLSMPRIIGFPKYDSVNILNPMTSHSYYKKKTQQIAAGCISFSLYSIEELNFILQAGAYSNSLPDINIDYLFKKYLSQNIPWITGQSTLSISRKVQR